MDDPIKLVLSDFVPFRGALKYIDRSAQEIVRTAFHGEDALSANWRSDARITTLAVYNGSLITPALFAAGYAMGEFIKYLTQ